MLRAGFASPIALRAAAGDRDLQNPVNWGYGQHIFEPIKRGSPQYNWLKSELESLEFQQAKYKLVMFHHPPHSRGDNIVPAYTDPVQAIDLDAAGNITAVRYEYPKEADYIIRDVMPLLESAGVQLVFYGWRSREGYGWRHAARAVTPICGIALLVPGGCIS